MVLRLTEKQARNLNIKVDGKSLKKEKSSTREKKVNYINNFSVEFCVPGVPRAKRRARTQISRKQILEAFIKARGSYENFSKLLEGIKHYSYTPKSTVDFEECVRIEAIKAMNGKFVFDGAVEIELIFKMKGSEEYWPTSHADPDLDNVIKAVQDALIGIVFLDDRLIVKKRGIKECGDEPMTVVRVKAVGADST